MSAANELPALITPDAIIKRLNLEIDGYRLREQVGKKANDEMRAELECARGDIKTAGEMVSARDVLIRELRACIERTRGDIHSPGMEEIVEAVLDRTPADAAHVLHGKLVRAGTFGAGGEIVTGFVIACSEDYLRALPSLPMYREVAALHAGMDVASLLADKARLDWMDEARTGVEWDMVDDHLGEHTRHVCYHQGGFPDKVRDNVRAAIDAARAQGGAK